VKAILVNLHQLRSVLKRNNLNPICLRSVNGKLGFRESFDRTMNAHSGLLIAQPSLVIPGDLTALDKPRPLKHHDGDL
jgi:hypothetical protein